MTTPLLFAPRSLAVSSFRLLEQTLGDSDPRGYHRVTVTWRDHLFDPADLRATTPVAPEDWITEHFRVFFPEAIPALEALPLLEALQATWRRSYEFGIELDRHLGAVGRCIHLGEDLSEFLFFSELQQAARVVTDLQIWADAWSAPQEVRFSLQMLQSLLGGWALQALASFSVDILIGRG